MQIPVARGNASHPERMSGRTNERTNGRTNERNTAQRGAGTDQFRTELKGTELSGPRIEWGRARQRVSDECGWRRKTKNWLQFGATLGLPEIKVMRFVHNESLHLRRHHPTPISTLWPSYVAHVLPFPTSFSWCRFVFCRFLRLVIFFFLIAIQSMLYGID